MAKTAKKVNLFEVAKSKPTKASNNTPTVEVVKTTHLESYACADALKKQIESLMKVLREPVEAQMMDKFISNRGENYKAEDGSASATLMCTKRSSASGLKPNEIELLEQHKIPMEKIEGDFKLNVVGVPMEKLQEVSDAISKIKDLPDDFIQFDTSKARTITTEESIKKVFLVNDVEVQKQLLKVASTFMIKPKTSARMEKIISKISLLLIEEDEDD